VTARDLHGWIVYLFAAYNQRLDDTVIDAYAEELRDVPPAELEAGVKRAIRESPHYVPSAGQVLEAVKAGREAAASPPYVPCGQCADGWLEVEPARNVIVGHNRAGHAVVSRIAPTVKRCECWLAWKRQGQPTPAINESKSIPRTATSEKVAQFKRRMVGQERTR